MNTPDHADEAIRGPPGVGIRSVFAYGFPNTSLLDWWFGPDYAGSVLTSDGAEARRLRKQYFSSDDGLITMALATRGPGFCKPDVVRHDWELAKELGLNITVHVAMDRFGYTKGQITGLRDMDLLYPNTTYVHASHFTDEEWALVRDSGGNVSFAPQIEVQMGHGWAPAGDGRSSSACRSGCRRTWPRPPRPTSSPRCTRSSDRSAAASTRKPGTRTSTACRRRRGSSPRARSCRWATLGGAEVAGIADRTGSLTPGKKADIVIIDGDGGERRADHRSGRGGGLRRGRLERQDRPRRRRDRQAGLQAAGRRSTRRARRSRRPSDYLLAKFGEPEPGWLPARA